MLIQAWGNIPLFNFSPPSLVCHLANCVMRIVIDGFCQNRAVFSHLITTWTVSYNDSLKCSSSSVIGEEALEEPVVICQGRGQLVLTFGTQLSGTKWIKQNKLTFETRVKLRSFIFIKSYFLDLSSHQKCWKPTLVLLLLFIVCAKVRHNDLKFRKKHLL